MQRQKGDTLSRQKGGGDGTLTRKGDTLSRKTDTLSRQGPGKGDTLSRSKGDTLSRQGKGDTLGRKGILKTANTAAAAPASQPPANAGLLPVSSGANGCFGAAGKYRERSGRDPRGGNEAPISGCFHLINSRAERFAGRP
jgi:hypothetical protein